MELTQEQKLSLLDEVMADKPLYRQIVKKVAEKHPDVYLPEVELGNEIDALRAESDKKLADVQAELQKERDARAAEAAMLAAKQTHGIDDAELAATTKFMAEHNIGNLDDGLRFKSLSDAADRKAAETFEDRNTMRLPDSFGAALKDRRGQRRKALYAGLQSLRRGAAHADILSTQ